MIRLLLSALIVLHGAVHIWFLLLSAKIVRYTPDMGWTGESWLFSGMYSENALRVPGIVVYGLSALLFIISGSGMLFEKNWYPYWLLLSAIVSSVAIIFFFDGSFQMLVQKVVIGLGLNILIIVTLIIRLWP